MNKPLDFGVLEIGVSIALGILVTVFTTAGEVYPVWVMAGLSIVAATLISGAWMLIILLYNRWFLRR